jgi:hypothetical protein
MLRTVALTADADARITAETANHATDIAMHHLLLTHQLPADASNNRLR